MSEKETHVCMRGIWGATQSPPSELEVTIRGEHIRVEVRGSPMIGYQPNQPDPAWFTFEQWQWFVFEIEKRINNRPF